MRESIAEYEVEARRSRLVPVTTPSPVTGRPLEFAKQWNALYMVPLDKLDLLPSKGDIQPGLEREADPETMKGEELEAAKKRDLLLPRVKDIKDQGDEDGCRVVVLHLIRVLQFEEAEVT